MTMLAEYHLTAHEQYSERIRQMKPREANQVFTVGSLSVDNIKNTPLYDREELARRFHVTTSKFVLVTYHPDTIKSRDENIKDFQRVLEAISSQVQYEYIFTFANQDSTGMEFNRMIMEFKGPRDRVRYIRYCGVELYLSLMSHAEMVLGNSSSGIMEAPYYGTPTVNIGRRQTGRVMVESVNSIPCENDTIVEAIQGAIPFSSCGEYGDGAVDNIVNQLRRIVC